ncbi:lipocalin-like domain-containing protein [Burkholderia dolosa]|uniref:lipocalin-like domain-containing protein n=1 Tax=Burkholderia dolosa TaxID=152500 RepID=UPI001B91A1FC|nr:lipocalin-like domain-containing protein [Burkholderia dolosa]MBR8061152.1 lipocalin-like domain-containing protein [Burkholderia dolosa]
MTASQLREQLVGAWRLVSYEVRPRDGGTVTYPLGRDARGWILYTPDGYMSAQLMAAGRPPYADGDLQGGTVEERAAAARGYIAYSGPYRVDDDGTLTHEMDVSLYYPNWIGNVQQRAVHVDGDRLQLGTAEPVRVDGREVDAVLVWARASR